MRILGHWVVNSVLCLVAYYGLFALAYAQSPNGVGAGLDKASSYLFGGWMGSVAGIFVILVLIGLVAINAKFGHDTTNPHGFAAGFMTLAAFVLGGLGLGLIGLSGSFGFLAVLAFGALFVGTAEAFHGTSYASLTGWFSGRFGGIRLFTRTPVVPTTVVVPTATPAPTPRAPRAPRTRTPAAPAAPAPIAPAPKPAPRGRGRGMKTPAAPAATPGSTPTSTP